MESLFLRATRGRGPSHRWRRAPTRSSNDRPNDVEPRDMLHVHSPARLPWFASGAVRSKSRGPLAKRNSLCYNHFRQSREARPPSEPTPAGDRSQMASELLGNSAVRRAPYPRPLSRGPIEAPNPKAHGLGATLYPRPLSRGPIEAGRLLL